jgi:CheY-like chemotaxis protein
MPTPVKLLLIDDQPSFVRALIRLLHRDGYTVETAANGHEALAQLPAHHYDVIVCDLLMPALDGRAFYDLLRRQFPSLCQRVIFVTGDTLGVDSTAFLAQCGQPYLYKPCTAAEVRSAIQQTLHAGASIAQGREARGAVDTGVSLREEGTLSIVQRSHGYHVRYASNNPYAQERPSRGMGG